MIGRESPPLFAVLDPRLPRNREMIAALGSDAVELERPPTEWDSGHWRLRVRFDAIRPGRQVAVCRMMADREQDTSFDWAFVSAVQLRALVLCSCGCYVCADPEVGRRYFAARDVDGRGDRP